MIKFIILLILSFLMTLAAYPIPLKMIVQISKPLLQLSSILFAIFGIWLSVLNPTKLIDKKGHKTIDKNYTINDKPIDEIIEDTKLYLTFGITYQLKIIGICLFFASLLYLLIVWIPLLCQGYLGQRYICTSPSLLRNILKTIVVTLVIFLYFIETCCLSSTLKPILFLRGAFLAKKRQEERSSMSK